VRPILHAHGHDSDRLDASVGRILAANTLCSMATHNAAGVVHVNAAFFCCSRDLILYFLSHPESVHSRNLRRLPQMAVAVFDSHQCWGDPHAGLQLFGAGGLASRDEAREARELYATRFPRYVEFLQRAPGAGPEGAVFRGLTFHRFVPERIQIFDEWEFGAETFITAAVRRELDG
jgi:uncharacterized protein YhbP (UPF0306 family)